MNQLHVWADVVYSSPPRMDGRLLAACDHTAPDPADWALRVGDDVGLIRAFVAWRQEFVHTMELGARDDVTVVVAWLRRRGHEYPLDGPGVLDQAAFSSAWYHALDEVPDHPTLRTVVDRMGSVALLSRSAHASVRLRVGPQKWPTPAPAPEPSA